MWPKQGSRNSDMGREHDRGIEAMGQLLAGVSITEADVVDKAIVKTKTKLKTSRLSFQLENSSTEIGELVELDPATSLSAGVSTLFQASDNGLGDSTPNSTSTIKNAKVDKKMQMLFKLGKGRMGRVTAPWKSFSNWTRVSRQKRRLCRANAKPFKKNRRLPKNARKMKVTLPTAHVVPLDHANNSIVEQLQGDLTQSSNLAENSRSDLPGISGKDEPPPFENFSLGQESTEAPGPNLNRSENVDENGSMKKSPTLYKCPYLIDASDNGLIQHLSIHMRAKQNPHELERDGGDSDSSQNARQRKANDLGNKRDRKGNLRTSSSTPSSSKMDSVHFQGAGYEHGKRKAGLMARQKISAQILGEDDNDFGDSSTPHKRPKMKKNLEELTSATDPTHTKEVKERVHKCQICSKGFSRADGLKRHMCIHTGEKRFKCPTCSKRFIQAVHLKWHSFSHMGEAPVKCDKCSKGFTQPAHLKTHVRNCHGNPK